MAIPKPEAITLNGDTLRSIIGKAPTGNVTIAATPWPNETEYGSSIHIPIRFLGTDEENYAPYILVLYANSPSYHRVVKELGDDETEWKGAKMVLQPQESRGRIFVAVAQVVKPPEQKSLGA